MSKIANHSPQAKADARDRAWRSFVQLILLDIVAALVPIATDILGQTDLWGSKSYWVTVAALLGKTILGVGLSYLMRLVKEPKTFQN